VCEFGLLADPQPGVDRAQAVAIDRMLSGQADLRKSFSVKSRPSTISGSGDGGSVQVQADHCS
jgi:hypothetical protein